MDPKQDKYLMKIFEEIDSDECNRYNNMSSDSEADNTYCPQKYDIDSSDSSIESEMSFK